MILRIFVYIYFPLISIGLYLSEKYNFQFARGIVFVMAAFYIVIRIINGYKSKIQKYSINIDIGIVLLYSYIIIYSLLYFPRSTSSVTGAITLTPILLVHTLFWDFLFTSNIYKKNLNKFFFDLFLSFLIGMIFLFLSSLNFTNFSIVPGSIHNIAEEWIMVSSDLDVPIMLLIVFSFIIMQFKVKKSKEMIIIPRIAILGIVILSIFMFWLYSRRGPIIALLGIVSFIFLPQKYRTRVFILFFFFPFIPMFWDIFSNFLLEISQTDIVSSFLARNNADDYLTATGRMVDWVRGIEFLLNFDVKHLIGYGGPTWFVVTEGRDHMHNVILTLIFDSGLITLFLFISLYMILLKRILSILDILDNKIWGPEALYLVLFIYLLFSPIEPLVHSHSYEHLIFLSISVVILRLNQHIIFRNTNSTEKPTLIYKR